MYSRIILSLFCLLLVFSVPVSFAGDSGDDPVKVEKKKKRSSKKKSKKADAPPAQKGTPDTRKNVGKGGTAKKEPAAVPADPFDQELLKDFQLPAKCPKLSESQTDRLEDKYDELLELYNAIKDQTGELKKLKDEKDERTLRHNQGKIRRIEGRIRRAKIALVRKVKQRSRPLQRRLAEQEALKKRYEARLAALEKSGNERQARKLTRDYGDSDEEMEETLKRIEILHYLLFWPSAQGGK